MVLRPLFLSLANRRGLRDLAMKFELGRTMSKRFVAGEERAEAMAVVHQLNQQQMSSTLDYLGENVEDSTQAQAIADEYKRVLDDIHRTGLKCNISIKLTALGLDLGEDLCFRNVEALCDHAAERNNFVRIDMEGSDYTDATLRIYERLRAANRHNTGVVLQAYLKRTAADIRHLMELGGLSVRLCKGAYKEAPEIAFQNMREIRRNFRRLASLLSDDTAAQCGVRLAVATHDPSLLRWAWKLYQQRGESNPGMEFQMLFGIRRDLQDKLIQSGCPLRIYTPYGEAWYPYFMRRLAERPENVAFVVRSLLNDLRPARNR